MGENHTEWAYDRESFSVSDLTAFATTTGSSVFKTAIQNYFYQHGKSTMGLTTKGDVKAMQAAIINANRDEVIANIGRGTKEYGVKKIGVDLKVLGELLVKCIEEEYLETCEQPHEFPDEPVVNVDVSGKMLVIHYSANYLRRSSLMSAWGEYRRIGTGLRDIYEFKVQGVKSNPKRVVGYWTSKSSIRKGAGAQLTFGNVHLQRGTDFVVEGVQKFLDTDEVKSVPYLRILIPERWRQAGPTVFYNEHVFY